MIHQIAITVQWRLKQLQHVSRRHRKRRRKRIQMSHKSKFFSFLTNCLLCRFMMLLSVLSLSVWGKKTSSLIFFFSRRKWFCVRNENKLGIIWKVLNRSHEYPFFSAFIRIKKEIPFLSLWIWLQRFIFCLFFFFRGWIKKKIEETKLVDLTWEVSRKVIGCKKVFTHLWIINWMGFRCKRTADDFVELSRWPTWNQRYRAI